jgi:hypothetical protein
MLFSQTWNGARVGDAFTTLIRTYKLCDANASPHGRPDADALLSHRVERHAADLEANPRKWISIRKKDGQSENCQS